MGFPVPTRRNCVTLINFTWHSDGNPLYEKNDLIIMFIFIVLVGSSLLYRQCEQITYRHLHKSKKKGKRKVQGVPQSQIAALPTHQEEEETDTTKHAQIEQHAKSTEISSLFLKRNRNAKRTEKHKNKNNTR